MTFLPFPQLTSNRILLRKVKETDANAILYLRSNKTVNQHIRRPENRQTKSIDEAIKFIQTQHNNLINNKSITWGICLKNELNIIGTICLWNFSEDKKTAEVGYSLKPDFHNKGIMSEALNLIIDFSFNQLKLQKIEAFTDCKNESSKRLLQKNRFYLNTSRIDDDNPSNLIYELNNKFMGT